MAKAVHVTGFGGADYASHMKLVDIEIPEPGPGQVLVQIYLRPVNPTDILFCSGAYGPDFPCPRVPGSEGRVVLSFPTPLSFGAILISVLYTCIAEMPAGSSVWH